MMALYFELKDNDEKNIFNKWNRTEKIVSEDVKTIQEWMKTHHYLPEVLDANSIKNFLIISKCSVEIAKQKIVWKYLIRQKIPDIFENINPRLPHMNRIFDAVYWIPLPKLNEDMGRVCISRVRKAYLCNQLDHHHYNGHHLYCIELCLRESLQLNVSIIFDLKDITSENFKKFIPSIFRKMVLFYHQVYTVSVKAVYLVNCPPAIHTFLPFVKTFLKRKLSQRIHICDSEKDLLKIFPKRIMPIDYGGEERSLEELNEIIKMKFLEYQDRFDEVENLVIDPNLRPDELGNDEFLGFYGNFRKLDID